MITWTNFFIVLGLCAVALVVVPIAIVARQLWAASHPNMESIPPDTPEQALGRRRFWNQWEPDDSLSREKDREEKGPQSGDLLGRSEEGGEESEN